MSAQDVHLHTKNILSFGTRVPGDEGHQKTQQYLISKLQEYGWQVSLDNFIDNTPFGPKNFTNIIGDYKSRGRERIILAAHYESKYFKDFTFLGATDSVVPCAMLLDLAKYIASKNWSQSIYDIQIVFFDGEEAFVTWTETDSLYGARHLAAKWEQENNLSNIKLFVLLDLLGAKNPTFYNFPLHHESDAKYDFEKLREIEADMRRKQQLENKQATNLYFNSWKPGGNVEDDYVPFARRGVPVLHLIPLPFPREWHTENDNENALHWESIQDLIVMIRRFVTEKAFKKK